MITSIPGSTTLILEGGGMRGLYTTGVLDSFLENGLIFSSIIGVSAGASHALSYITRQKGRSRRVNVDYCRRPDYMGLRCLLREGSYFGMDLIFRKIPFELDPLDFQLFEKNVGNYYAVATNVQTGQAEYFAPRKAEEILSAVQASCSLPLVSRPIVINGVPYLDGGIADSIPVRRALQQGSEKLVVVLTQPRFFRKAAPQKHSLSETLCRARYARYPAFLEVLLRRNILYNETLDYIDALEAEGVALVLRPEPQQGLSRLERDPERLSALHRSGYQDGMAMRERLEAFVR